VSNAAANGGRHDAVVLIGIEDRALDATHAAERELALDRDLGLQPRT